jgi:hypothetical protein
MVLLPHTETFGENGDHSTRRRKRRPGDIVGRPAMGGTFPPAQAGDEAPSNLKMIEIERRPWEKGRV